MLKVKRYLKRVHAGEKGQMLAFLLILLAFGGVTIATSLNFTTTILSETRVVKNKTSGIYSASAGVDYAIWSLENGEAIPETLSETVNGLTIEIEDIDHGVFTMYCGELEYVGELPSHYDWITANTSAVCGVDTCNYTITVYWNGDPSQQRQLTEVGATLPAGYTYVEESAADFPSNMASGEPETGQAPGGANWVKWTWKSGKGPDIGKTVTELTQTFTISGSGDMDGDYCWVTAQTGDIGLVGEITGQRYTIISTAVNPDTGLIAAEIDADLLVLGGTVYISSWQIVR